MSIPRLLKVTPREDRSLVLEYDSGERKVFDVNPYISGSWYGELGEIPYFNTVSVVSGEAVSLGLTAKTSRLMIYMN